MSIHTPANRRILVIDDNHAIHSDFRKILEAPKTNDQLDEMRAALFSDLEETPALAGYEIDSAFQGEEGLQRVHEALQAGRPYSMAFVDVRMPPGWDGIETISKIWEVYPDLQVVICTAYSDYSLEEMLARLGHSDRMVILKKPFDNVEVLQLANALTEKWRLTQAARIKLEDLENVVVDRTRELTNANEMLQAEIVERTRAEVSLRTTQEKLSHLLAKSPVAIYSAKIEGPALRPTWASENITFMMGCSVEEWCQPQWHAEHLHPADRGAHAASLVQLFTQGQSSGECRYRHRNGTYYWVRDDRKLLCDSEGRPVDIVGAWIDITDCMQLQEQLRQAQKMEAIGQLAGGVAHDFNNLLTVIQGYTHLLLKDGPPNAKSVESLNQVNAAAERAATLTRQLLAYSRKQVMQSRDLDLNELVEHLTKMLHRLLGEDLALQIQLSPGLPAIHADHAMVEQIIINLAVNARDAMPAGGTLSIRTAAIEIDNASIQGKPEARAGSFICLSVTDVGCGIAPEILSRLFEPFFTTKPVGQGTGLGLATVYGIAKQHLGWVEVESEVGRGSTFKVYLPKAAKSTEVLPPAKTAPQIACGGSETILLVEDEKALCELSRLVLERCGYKVLEAGCGPEALRVWQEHGSEIDLLLTDMVMPDGLTGRELAKKLQVEKPRLKVTYTSGYSLDLIGRDFKLEEGLNFLPKPYHPQKLAQVVRACLDDDSKIVCS